MPKPVKWSRDLHAIRERAARSRTETWARKDVEDLFGVRPSSAQSLMKAIGGVTPVGGTHFVDRAALLGFLDEMVQAESVEDAMRIRLERSAPVPRPAPLRVALPAELRPMTLADLPANVEVRPGEVRITGAGTETVVEGLLLLAQVLQNDLESVRLRIEPPPPERDRSDMDEGLREMLRSLRSAPQRL